MAIVGPVRATHVTYASRYSFFRPAHYGRHALRTFALRDYGRSPGPIDKRAYTVLAAV
jgi:hypothetical protein